MEEEPPPVADQEPDPGSDPPVPVVLLGLDELVGLQAARVFSERGVPVVGLGHDRRHPAWHTRSASEKILCPADEASLLGVLSRRGPAFHPVKPVLLPCTDDHVLFVDRHRDILASWYRFPLPPEGVLEMLTDKSRFAEFARREDLPVPLTFLLDSPASARRAAESISYPCVLKPVMKNAAWWERTGVKVLTIADADALVEAWEDVHKWAGPLIAQEWIPGGDGDLFTCNAYFDDRSQPLASFVSRKIRQWPPHTGVASLSETCNDETVLRESLRCLERARLRGLGYVEMKRDPETGRYFIIEANVGRPTGRSSLAEACGVELFMAMYCDLLGLPMPAERTGGAGKGKWIHVINDLRSAWHYWRRGELTLWGWLKSLVGVRRAAVIDFRDPAPSIIFLLEGFLHLLTSRGGARARRSRPD